MSAKQLVDHFAGLDDPRCDGKVEHLLIDILVIAVCAVIAGAESWVEMALYGLEKEDWLRSFLALPNGIPAHDTFDQVRRLDKPTPRLTTASARSSIMGTSVIVKQAQATPGFNGYSHSKRIKHEAEIQPEANDVEDTKCSYQLVGPLREATKKVRQVPRIPFPTICSTRSFASTVIGASPTPTPRPKGWPSSARPVRR
jgi:hypothetical protein